MTRARTAPAAFAALVAAAGCWVGVQSAAIAESGGYSPVGPRFFPIVVAALLIAVGLALLVRALRGHGYAVDDAPAADASQTAGKQQPTGASPAVNVPQAVKVSHAADRPSEAPTHAPYRAALGWLSAAMLVSALLINRAGFVIAMAAAFWLASRAFTARLTDTLLRDAVVAVLVAVVVQLFFAKVLGLRLPSGPFGL